MSEPGGRRPAELAEPVSAVVGVRGDGAVAPSERPVPARRAVAVAGDAMELLRPHSDLARLLESFATADVLLAAEDTPTLDDFDDFDDLSVPVDEVRERAAALGHPGLVVHRLGLRPPLGPATEPDMVAALSELVGFDPEPGVYCLAPAQPPPGVTSPGDPGRVAAGRAAQRIAQIYGIPLLRYRCLELSVVDGAGG